MLPDFPKIKRGLREAVNKHLRDLVRQDPLLSQIKEEPHFEGDKMVSALIDGQPSESVYQEISAGYRISREDVIAKGPMAYIENIRAVAEEIKKQKAQLVFGRLEQILEKTGGVVDAKGRPLTFELFLEFLEGIHIEFDDQGRPRLPTLVISPVIAAEVQHKLAEWNTNPEYKKKHEDLMERKRKEWNDRESHRKLVD